MWSLPTINNEKTSTLQDFVLWGCSSPNPSIVGLAILCIAVCLQQLDTRVHHYIIRQLPQLPGELFQEYFEKVDSLILNDSDYASTEEGIEVAILSAKTYSMYLKNLSFQASLTLSLVNLGLNKKCWVLLHRAVAYCQLLGYHRPERLSAGETDAERCRRNQFWLFLCSADVYSSLILGLPYAADGRTIPITKVHHNATAIFLYNLTLISAKVVDRNQMGLSLSVSRTEEIQKEIEAATKDFDETFWNAAVTFSNGEITREEYLERLATQCWFYQLLVLLYMPLMIHSVEDARLEKHRAACLDASRNLLRIHNTMRSEALSAFNMVKLIDYQAFICSTLLVLGLLGYGSKHQTENQDKDRDLIGLTMANLRQASVTANNTTASQSVQGLETLMFLDRGGDVHQRGTGCGNPYARIVVPDIGTITITPGEYYTNSKVGSISPCVLTHPVFALSHGILQESSGQVDQTPTQASNTGYDGLQTSSLEFGGDIQPELPSIDFDWTSTTMPSFENDWAWLNDQNY
jgi:hypothetical protein